MNTKSARALLFTLLSLLSVSLAAHDDSNDHRNDHHRRPRAADLADCCTPGDADFPKVSGNLGNQSYSSLREINRNRVKRLGAVWVNHIEGGLTTGTNQSTPVVVDGVIYIESAFGNVDSM